jgi:N-acetylmuramoyl-L-alanine amidase
MADDMRSRALTWLLAVALAVLLSIDALALDVPRLTHRGRPYVGLDAVAGELAGEASLAAGTEHARLVVGKHVVVVSRDSSRVMVGGKSVILAAPAVVRSGKWLVSEDFLTEVIPRIAPGARGTAAPPPSPGSPSRARATAPGDPGPGEVEPIRPPAPRPVLAGLRSGTYSDYTRVVVQADAPFRHDVERHAGQVHARLAGLGISEARVEEINDGRIGQVRLGRAGDDVVVTLMLQGPIGELKVFTLTRPYRLVLDVYRARESAGNGPERDAKAEGIRHVVLDAGHGGHDSGAIGPTGLMEKDLVLDVARRVARLVEERLRLKVTQSRSADYFVPLRERASIANRAGADLFISIHANAHRDMASAGVETYFLSLEATDSAARQVAERENQVIELENHGTAGQTDMVRGILWDLAQQKFREESSVLAEVVQDSMTESLRIPNRGVKQAGFYVLGGAAMPAVLIEIGFVTNRREERRLRDRRYRDDIAQAIFAGIAAYQRRSEQPLRAGLDPAPAAP